MRDEIYDEIKFGLKFLLVVVCGALVMLRFHGHKDAVFQAVSHIVVGLLSGLAVSSKSPARWGYVALMVVMSVAEVIAFLFLA